MTRHTLKADDSSISEHDCQTAIREYNTALTAWETSSANLLDAYENDEATFLQQSVLLIQQLSSLEATATHHTLEVVALLIRWVYA